MTDLKYNINNKVMKAYTDLNQSKKLAEILPLESADMCWTPFDEKWDAYIGAPNPDAIKKEIPCWSLAALLNILDYPQLSKDKLGMGKEGWMVSVYPDNCRYDSSWHDNPIDCCVEMICKIYEIYSEKYFLI